MHAAGAPAWVTVTVCPATVSVPVRSEVPVFAATTNVIVPFPVPPAPAPMVSQEVVVDADQAQESGDAVTPI